MELKYIVFGLMYVLAFIYWLDLVKGFRNVQRSDRWYMYTPIWFLMPKKLNLNKWFCLRGAIYNLIALIWVIYILN
jgi:hypothetical protein